MEGKAEFLGLVGFTVSGLLFVVSAVRTGDPFALVGSILWTLSCLVWIGAILVARDTRNRTPAQLVDTQRSTGGRETS